MKGEKMENEKGLTRREFIGNSAKAIAYGTALAACVPKPVAKVSPAMDVNFHGIPSALLLEEDFETIDRKKWEWYIVGKADRRLTPEGIELRVKETANDKSYSNAEFYNHGTPYKYNFAQMRLKNTNLQNGSRGWGFWNGSMDTSNCHLAWFGRYQRPKGEKSDEVRDITPNGFYTVTRNNKKIERTRIEDKLLQKWCTYSIDWREDSVAFWINNEKVAEHKKENGAVPNRNMRFDTWIDNAVYVVRKDGKAMHLYQNISKPTSIHVDNLKILKLSNPYQPPTLSK